MTTPTRPQLNAEKSLGGYTQRHARKLYIGELGNNSGVVDDTARTTSGQDFVFVRLNQDANQVVSALAATSFPHVADIIVILELVERKGAPYYQVLGIAPNIVYSTATATWSGSPGAHANQHERRDRNAGGFDPLDVYTRALVNLRARAQITPNLTLHIERGFYIFSSVKEYVGGNSPAFVPPAAAGSQRWDLLYLGNDDALHITTGVAATGFGTPTYPACPTDAIPLAYVTLRTAQTSILEADITDARVLWTANSLTPPAHNVLSASHGDTLVGTVVDGDVIIGNATPKWSRLAIAIPAANVRNVLGIDNGELRPSWKTALDATGPADIASTAAAGTSLLFPHRDHAHRGVTSVNKSGGATLYGAVTLSEGANVTLTQTGQDIEIEATPGSILTVKEEDGIPSVANVTEIRVTNGTLTDNTGGSVSLDFGSAATDGAAIHDNVAGEIAAIAEKATPVDADLVIIEDSADSNNKKRVQVGNLPGGAGGAPDDAEYVTAAASAGLSAEVVIPGLAGNADLAGAGGGGISEEYDSSSENVTWDVAPTAHDSDTTVKSHLYVKQQTTAATKIGTRAWTPGAGAFDVRTKVGIGSDTPTAGVAGQIGLYLANNDSSLRALIRYGLDYTNKRNFLDIFTYASATWTSRLSGWYLYQFGEIYLRITRDGSNNLTFYVSTSGKAGTWQALLTYGFTLTVALVGYYFNMDSANSTVYAISDWLRTDV